MKMANKRFTGKSKRADKTRPYEIIQNFFRFVSPERSRSYILSMLISAARSGYWSEADPGSLLEFEEELGSLLYAVSTLSVITDTSRGFGKKAVLDKKLLQMPLDLSLISGWPVYDVVWEYFPRHLSKAEFLNPYLVFREFFAYSTLAGWKSRLHRVIVDALSVLPEVHIPDYPLLETYKLLQKLVEAAYLVASRTAVKNGNLPQKGESGPSRKQPVI